MMLISRKMFFLFLVAMMAFVSAPAQDSEKIVSGDYESLLLAVSPDGELTGYFDEGTGDDGTGRPRFSCTFFIFGEKQADGSYKVSTWYPGESIDAVVTGKLKYAVIGGNPGINLHLDAEHGGCWNVSPQLKEAAGVDFSLYSSGKWEGIRMISPAKAYFYLSTEAKVPQKTFVVRNNAVRVFSVRGEWAEVAFTGSSGKTTKGWMKTANFYSIKPPAAK